MKAPYLFSLSLFFFAACNGVYLEKPVPQSGKDATAIPADWSGVYAVKELGKDPDSTIFKECLRMERLSNTQLMISSETRLAKKDIPALEQQFRAAQKAGQLTDFKITSRFIYSIQGPQPSGQLVRLEQQITTLVAQGDWYVLANSIKPLMLLDLDQKTTTSFEVGVSGARASDLIPEADSLSSSNYPLVFREKQKTYFLNIQNKDQTKWSLYTISKAEKDDLIIKINFLKDKSEFQKQLEHYNAITFFQPMNGDYLIDPTDKALEQLLADPGLFETWYLRKIGVE